MVKKIMLLFVVLILFIGLTGCIDNGDVDNTIVYEDEDFVASINGLLHWWNAQIDTRHNDEMIPYVEIDQYDEAKRICDEIIDLINDTKQTLMDAHWNLSSECIEGKQHMIDFLSNQEVSYTWRSLAYEIQDKNDMNQTYWSDLLLTYEYNQRKAAIDAEDYYYEWKSCGCEKL